MFAQKKVCLKNFVISYILFTATKGKTSKIFETCHGYDPKTS